MTSRPEHRLLGVFAHPDDETLGAGPLLALAVDAGVDVSLVTCTRGERGEVIPPELAGLAGDPDGLGRHREEELAAALAELGVHRHLYLDQVPGLAEQRPSRFRDSGMRWVRPGIAGPGHDAGPDAFTAVDLDVAATLLAVVVRHLRPTAVLTEEPGGGYGHPDHVRAHEVTMRAVEIAAGEGAPAGGPLDGLAPWRVPTVLWVAQDEAHLRAALAELAGRVAGGGGPVGPDGAPLTVPDPAGELPGIAVPGEEIGATLDSRQVTARVLAAVRAHRTQVQAVAEVPDGVRLVGRFALSNGVLMPVLDRAYLRAAPGSDVVDLAAVLATPPTVRRPAPGAPRARPPAPTGAAAPASEASAEPARRGPLTRLVAAGGATGAVVSLLAGLVMGMLGTVVHRYMLEGWPAGVALGLAGVLAAAVAARAIAGGGGLLLAALGVVVITQAMAFLRPGGDVLVTDETISYVWLFGAPLAAVAAALLPARWFSDGRARERSTP